MGVYAELYAPGSSIIELDFQSPLYRLGSSDKLVGRWTLVSRNGSRDTVIHQGRNSFRCSASHGWMGWPRVVHYP